MRTTAERLTSLTAADLMSRDVLTIPRAMSLRAAAHLLAQLRVSGAPVVDERGACVGVISATDFLRRADGQRKDGLPAPRSDCVCADWQMVEIDTLPAEAVCSHMTADPVMVPPHMPIRQLARAMVDAHIHRVIVTDARERPIGVVSSTDVLAAVARTEAGE